MNRKQRRQCPHVRKRGIYGDEINHTPGGLRLQCLDCGNLLDGPVSLVNNDRDAWDAGFKAGIIFAADPHHPPIPNPYRHNGGLSA